ncbi:MAG: SPOR domain-containing protein [Gammaproteobacteria bacterium]|nr:SPOR domain-containing protein [Gammaproteobacteria bacterium]
MPAANRRPRSRSGNRRSRRDGGFSFSSFMGGVVLGGAVVLAISYQSGTPSSGGASPDAAPVEEHVATNIDWEFIDRLPNTEVKTGVEPAEQPPVAESGPREYVLHAPQFLREEDAQVMQAELMLDGMPASLQTSPRDLGGAWYRVLVGPYSTEPDAQKALDHLRERDIPAQILARPLSVAAPAA